MWFKRKPFNKRERKQSRIYPSSLTNIDLVEFFDALFEYVCVNEQFYARLSELARENFNAHGRGIFVVDAVLENKSSDIMIETDVSQLCRSFTWWNHEKCEAEMPDYLSADCDSMLCTSLSNDGISGCDGMASSSILGYCNEQPMSLHVPRFTN